MGTPKPMYDLHEGVPCTCGLKCVCRYVCILRVHTPLHGEKPVVAFIYTFRSRTQNTTKTFCRVAAWCVRAPGLTLSMLLSRRRWVCTAATGRPSLAWVLCLAALPRRCGWSIYVSSHSLLLLLWLCSQVLLCVCLDALVRGLRRVGHDTLVSRGVTTSGRAAPFGHPLRTRQLSLLSWV